MKRLRSNLKSTGTDRCLHGKMITLIFEDGEEAVIQNILSMVGTKARVYDAGLQDKCTLVFHGLVLDELQHIVLREGRKVELTSTEFENLDLLARHPGVVFGREKIEDDPAQPAYIQTVWGVLSVLWGNI